MSDFRGYSEVERYVNKVRAERIVYLAGCIPWLARAAVVTTRRKLRAFRRSCQKAQPIADIIFLTVVAPSAKNDIARESLREK